MLIDRITALYSLKKQSLLLGINWSTLHYKPVGISECDYEMMRLLDEQHTKTPFYGVVKMTEFLRSKEFVVGKDHVRTLLRKMGLFAVFAKQNLSKPHPEHRIYPYLLRDVEIVRPNQVWSADITYVRLAVGFAYLMAIIDWFSRYVLSWRLSNTLDSGFCVEALEEALTRYSAPAIFNTDQGSQFTSDEFIRILTGKRISISMDGKGRAHDNIFVERLWRSVKYENIYLNDYQDIPEAKDGLVQYFDFYNRERFHQSLDYKTPEQVYLGRYQTITGAEKIGYRLNACESRKVLVA
jgi:putative transposase